MSESISISGIDIAEDTEDNRKHGWIISLGILVLVSEIDTVEDIDDNGKDGIIGLDGGNMEIARCCCAIDTSQDRLSFLELVFLSSAAL